MKAIHFIFCLIYLGNVFAQEAVVSGPAHNFNKNQTITLQGNIGVSYLPDGNSGSIAYGFTGLFEKNFLGLVSIFSGISYTEITDKENFRDFVSSDSIRQQHVKYRSVTVPVGVALKIGAQKHRLYPLISVAIGPQFNIDNGFASVKTVSFMAEGRAGLGINVVRYLSFESGLVYHGSLTSVREGETRHPMLFGWFLGMNVNL